MNRARFAVLAGIAAGLLLIAGLVHLFLLRFQAGDIYPPYSSLRADPLGAKAFYESLTRCPNLSVSRNHQDLTSLDLSSDTTLLFLGDTVSFEPNDDYIPGAIVGWLEGFVRRGGRLVITLQPRTWAPPDPSDDAVEPEDEEEKSEVGSLPRVARGQKSEDGGQDLEVESQDEGSATNQVPEKDAGKPPRKRHREFVLKEDGFEGNMALTNWLGTAFALMPPSGSASATLGAEPDFSDLPPSLSCHTFLCFSNAAPAWKAVYRRNGNPVMMERRVGKGSFVLSTMSFFSSNEALRDERRPELLAWLIGRNRHVIFDETHHGIFESRGMTWLMRKYRLSWLGIGLLVLAGLFIWQNGTSLVPAETARAAPDVARGKGSTSGLVNILRRHVATDTVLELCVKEWKRTLGRAGPELEQKIREVDAILERDRSAPIARRDPARTYNDISTMLKRK